MATRTVANIPAIANKKKVANKWVYGPTKKLTTPLWSRQTDRHSDRGYKNITSSANTGGNYNDRRYHKLNDFLLELVSDMLTL